MTRKLQLLRGTTAQNNAFTGSSGELTVDTTLNELRVHDGATQGGHTLAKKATTLSGYGITDGANTDFSNLTATGKNIGNWSSNLTNCITKIPQDIKLELNNGTLTLQAGSKCYLKTDTTTPSVNIAADLTTTQTTNGTYFAIYNGSGLTTVLTTTYDYSGLPNTYSLPLALIRVSGGTISSIDQVFNGYGYIGSTVFVLPGVKGLISNARNADETCKNTTFSISTVLTVSAVSGWNGRWTVYTDGSLLFLHPTELEYTSNTKPTAVAGTEYWWCPQDNILYYTSDTGATWNNSGQVALLRITESSAQVTSITPKLAFCAVDYNDTKYIAEQSAPSDKYIDLTLGSSTHSVTAPADGWFTIRKGTNASEYLLMTNTSNNLISGFIWPGAGGTCVATVPVKQGDIVTIEYNASGSVVWFRFVYAQGSK